MPGVMAPLKPVGLEQLQVLAISRALLGEQADKDSYPQEQPAEVCMQQCLQGAEQFGLGT